VVGEKAGIAAAIETVGVGEAPAAGGEQLSMLPGDDEAPTGAGERAARGPGRPAGARNRRTKEMVDWLLRQRGLRSPLEVLVELANRDTRDLARELGAESLIDVVKLRVSAAVAALPYVEQKQPVAIEAEGSGGGIIQINLGASSDAPAGLGLPLAKIEEIQDVSDDDLDLSDLEQSDDDAK